MNKEYIQKAKEEYEFIIFDYFKEEIKFKNKYIDEEYERDEEYKGDVENDIRNYYGDLYYEAKGEIITAIIKSCVGYFYHTRHNNVILKDKTITAESDVLFLTIKFILYSQGFDQFGDIEDRKIFDKRYDEKIFYKMLECFCEVLVVVDPKGFQEIVDGDY